MRRATDSEGIRVEGQFSVRSLTPAWFMRIAAILVNRTAVRTFSVRAPLTLFNFGSLS